ncbi:MAG: alpha/beta family hydrolase [Candidatus Binatia bacterium]
MLEQRQIAIADDTTVSTVVAYPDCRTAPTTAVILAHGAGNDMTNPFLSAVHEGLAAHGFIAVKFNFPYKERGRRPPDPAPVLERCYGRVIDAVRGDRRIAPRRLVIGGKSLGGRMASHLAAHGVAVDGLIFLGYPLHPVGKVEQLRVAHLEKIRAPMLFVTGTRDALCRLDLLRQTIQRLQVPVTLEIVEGGDHSFNVPKAMRRDPRAVWDEIVTASARWLAKLA